MEPTRRDLVHALAAMALVGCGSQRAALSSLPDGPATLGWRWVPGQTLSYRTVSERVAGRVVLSRAETWTYLVRDLDERNIATLQGRLSAFGAGMTIDGKPVPRSALQDALDEERQLAARPVTVQLGMDGRLISCSEEGFALGLPHRLLALRVPANPVSVHDEWSDPAVAGTFGALVPIEAQAAVWGTARLLEWFRDGDAITAVLEVLGRIETRGDGPTLLIEGSARWDAGRGVLARRALHATLDPPSSDPEAGPGRLTLSLELV